MKVALTLFLAVFAFFLADFLFSERNSPERAGVSDFAAVSSPGTVPFDHAFHGDSIGLDCSKCHTGARSAAHAYMPSRTDCLDCHRLPLTESPAIEKLDSALAHAPENPWSHKSVLPEHVVFHHGVHAAAGVTCADCHGNVAHNSYGGKPFNMETCIRCHRGETFVERNFRRASTECATCHR